MFFLNPSSLVWLIFMSIFSLASAAARVVVICKARINDYQQKIRVGPDAYSFPATLS